MYCVIQTTKAESTQPFNKTQLVQSNLANSKTVNIICTLAYGQKFIFAAHTIVSRSSRPSSPIATGGNPLGSIAFP